MLKKILLLTAALATLFPQASAINLGGTEVPKDKFIVYLLIGHSQMAGVITTNNDNVTNPHAWVYRWETTKIWELAKETGSNRAGLSGRGTGGPGMPFLKGMVSRHSDYYFGVISNASPSSTCHGINSGSNGSNLSAEQNRYWRDATLFHELITAAREVQNDATLGGILCMLGTIEATRAVDVTVCQNFSTDIAQMVADMRDSLGLPKLPFIVADYEKGAKGDFSVSLEWPAIIAEQTDLVPSKVSNSVEINSAGIPLFDDHHFTIAGQGVWAGRAIDSLHAHNFFPPPGTSVILETPVASQKKIPGLVVLSYTGGRVRIDYRPLMGKEAHLSIFDLNGKRLLQEQMTGAGGVLCAVWDKRSSPAARNNGNCYIVKIDEANHQCIAKLYTSQP
jgi:hypothetical protein